MIEVWLLGSQKREGIGGFGSCCAARIIAWVPFINGSPLGSSSIALRREGDSNARSSDFYVMSEYFGGKTHGPSAFHFYTALPCSETHFPVLSGKTYCACPSIAKLYAPDLSRSSCISDWILLSLRMASIRLPYKLHTTTLPSTPLVLILLTFPPASWYERTVLIEF